MTWNKWRGDAQGRAQVTHLTPANVEIGDIFTITCNRKDVSYAAAAATVADVVNGLISALSAAAELWAEFTEMTASVGYDDGGAVTHLILTGASDGTPFTVTASTTEGGISLSIDETQAGDPGQNEIQRITLAGATGGTFTLTFAGQTTGNIAWNASAATVQTALVALSNIASGDVTVTGSAGGPWSVEFKQVYANTDVALITGDGTNLTKSGYGVSVTTITQGDAGLNEIQSIVIEGPPTGGTYTLTFDGLTTGNIAYNADASAVQTALVALTNIASGDVAVSGDYLNGFTVEFKQVYRNLDVTQIIGNGANLTGAASVSGATTTAGSPGSIGIARVMQLGAGTPYVSISVLFPGVVFGSAQWAPNSSAIDVRTALAAALGNNFNVTRISGGWDISLVGVLTGLAFEVDGSGTNNVTSAYAPTTTVTKQRAGGEGGANEVQVLTLVADPTGGTYTLTFQGQTTGTIAYNASAATVQTALEALSNIAPGDVTVTGSAGGPYTVTFGGVYAGVDVGQITGTGTSLTGAGITVLTSQAATAYANEVEQVGLTGSPFGGTFTLTFNGETTSGIAYNASAATVQAALEALATPVPGDFLVAGSAGGPWTITFQGAYKGSNVTAMTGSGASLSGVQVLTGTSQEAASTVNEVQTVTVTQALGGTFTLTYGGNTTAAIPYNAAAGVVEVELQALASVGSGNCAVSGSAGGPWSVEFTGTLAGTDLVLMTGSGAGLTGIGSQSLTVTEETTPTGPCHFDNAENWSLGSVPVDGQDVLFSDTANDCLYGLSNSTITPASIYVDASYTGSIGLEDENELGYTEYRTKYLTLGNSGDAQAISLFVGRGAGGGASLVRFNAGTAQLLAHVYNAGSDGGGATRPAVLLLGSHASNEVNAYKGSVGVAYAEDETATVSILRLSSVESVDTDASVVIGAGVTLGTVTKLGGQLEINCAIGTSFMQYAGETTIQGTGAPAQIYGFGGKIYYNSTGAIGGNSELSGDCLLIFDRDLRAKSITNPINVYGDEADVIDSAKIAKDAGSSPATLTIDYNQTTRQPGLGRNYRIVRQSVA